LRNVGLNVSSANDVDAGRLVYPLMAFSHIIEAVLNHVSGHKAGVAGIYNRGAYAKEKREALELWANQSAGACRQSIGRECHKSQAEAGIKEAAPRGPHLVTSRSIRTLC
jgi:hypothetical protein